MNASSGVPGCAMILRNMYKNDERWLSHKYYVSYMIMQSNMTMNTSHINGTVEVAWQYILEWLWKCHNR